MQDGQKEKKGITSFECLPDLIIILGMVPGLK